MTRLKSGYCFVVGLLLISLSNHLGAAEPPSTNPLVVFLVRHAEKVDASRDPALSVIGKERAAVLALTLRDAGVQRVHSSDYIRTRDTAAPIAARRQLKVDLYDPRDLPALVKKLRKAGGRHLVVGHSTSTPAAVKLLGGKPGNSIDEAGEFDRLYLVTVAADGAVSTVLMRYGRPFNLARSP